ncbi:hypothetical protein DVH24_028804 [Malus domestica]|uniref:Uncharacterized protein n=1 Tax=Malus domestica TaxID=3750 RepID=A0A498IYW8_MALDO|nr:hypothetical protein DVH24_028804 [Malus domestica]
MQYETMNEFETAISLLKRTLALLERLPQEQHSEGSVSARIGWLLLLTGKVSHAIPYLESAAERLKESFGPKHFGVGYIYNNLGAAYLELERPQSAAQMFTIVKDIMDVSLGPYHADSIESCQNLSKAYAAMGRYNTRSYCLAYLYNVAMNLLFPIMTDKRIMPFPFFAFAFAFVFCFAFAIVSVFLDLPAPSLSTHVALQALSLQSNSSSVVDAWEGHGPSAEDELKEAHRVLEQLKFKSRNTFASNEFTTKALPIPQTQTHASDRSSQGRFAGLLLNKWEIEGIGELKYGRRSGRGKCRLALPPFMERLLPSLEPETYSSWAKALAIAPSATSNIKEKDYKKKFTLQLTQ